MAAAIKKEAAAPPQQQLPAVLAKKPTEKDLIKIAEAIGSNWEMLGPHLISENSTSLVERIKMDYNNETGMEIYNLLLIWTREAGHLATFGRLFFLMLQAGSSVTIGWDSLARYLKITLEDIRACKDGFDTSSVAPAILAKKPTEKDLLKIAEAIGSNWEMLGPHLISENSTSLVERIKDKNVTEMPIYKLLLIWTREAGHLATFGRLFFLMLQAGSSVTIGWNSLARYLKITLEDIRACKDGFDTSSVAPVARQLSNQGEEEMKVIYDRTFDGQSVEDETDAPSLRTKRREKEYRHPKDSCIYDGRLLKLEKKDIECLEKNCTEIIGTGGCGEVYTSKADLEEFGMRVAVKKIPSDTRAASRERIASRILHPFILPLLAVVDSPNKEKVWFVSPYCENKDLNAAIEKDQKNQNTVSMNQATRIRILFQISLALEYIHTKVPNVRNVVLHKDISSKNIVLDRFLNARLIDFGLAREKNDATTRTGGTIAYLHPDYGDKTANESWDYFAFGVVIREMLTGLKPDGQRFMKFWQIEEVEEKLQKNIWPLEVAEIREKANALNRIADACLKKKDACLKKKDACLKKKDACLKEKDACLKEKDACLKEKDACLKEKETEYWTVTHFKKNVVDELYKIWNKPTDLYATSKDYSRCHMCMINPAVSASKSSLKQKHAGKCTQKIRTCMTCEKNSFLNPIRCYCETDLKPSIGYNWGALLVAGNDTDSTSLAEALTKDLTEIKKLITSKAPLIMGISEENVRIIVPDKPGKQCEGDGETISSKVKKEIEYFRSASNIDTLLIYFSCHGIKGNGSEGDCKNRFKLGSSVLDSITQEEFEKELVSLRNINNLLVILDRCFPPILTIKGRDQFVQINACKKDQKADFNDDGSTFTKYLIQGLKARSEEKKCKDDCRCCDEYWEKREDFISVRRLFNYVKDHMEKVNDKLVPDMQQKTGWDCIAYYTDEVVEVDFTCKGDKKHIPLTYFQDMCQLKEKILKEFKKDKMLTRVKIKKNTFRKEDQFEDCDTLEKVMLAWTHRQPLEVYFEASNTL